MLLLVISKKFEGIRMSFGEFLELLLIWAIGFLLLVVLGFGMLTSMNRKGCPEEHVKLNFKAGTFVERVVEK